MGGAGNVPRGKGGWVRGVCIMQVIVSIAWWVWSDVAGTGRCWVFVHIEHKVLDVVGSLYI